MNTDRPFAIATAHRLASEAGRDVLASGGNAFDAAIAAAVTLTVVEPGNSGVGGEGYCIFFDATRARTGVLCFMGEPCARATPEAYLGRELERGVLAPVVPAAAQGWFALLSAKGNRPAEEVFARAVHFAREGFLVGPEAGALNWMANQWHESAGEIFRRDDRPWEDGDLLRQPDLAGTLENLARHGIGYLYTGEFADAFDSFFEASGGLVRSADLAALEVRWQSTLSAEIGDAVVHVPPPESTGFSVLYGLKLLEAIGLKGLDLAAGEYHRLTVAVLYEMLAASGDLSDRMEPYDREVLPEIEKLLDTEAINASADRLQGEPSSSRQGCAGPSTTSLSVADGDGNLVCLTQTLDHGFGSGVVVPGTGVLLNNGMAWIDIDPSAATEARIVGPRKHYFAPVVPTVSISRSGEPFLALGTPGGCGIPQTTLQVLTRVLLLGEPVDAAIAEPRMVVGSIGPGIGSAEQIQVETGLPDDVYSAIGTEPSKDDLNVGAFHAVAKQPDGSWRGLADPRGDGLAVCG